MKNDKDEPKMDSKTAAKTVKSLLNASMSKGKIKAIKLKVKMK